MVVAVTVLVLVLVTVAVIEDVSVVVVLHVLVAEAVVAVVHVSEPETCRENFKWKMDFRIPFKKWILKFLFDEYGRRRRR